jgi:hypothetical protein
MPDLVLETKGQEPGGIVWDETVMITTPLGEDYWAYRVLLNDTGQAILGFPKFSTIGIGFAQEEDGNTNLPYTCSTEEIFEHIKHNKADPEIPDSRVLVAIEMVRAKAMLDRVIV